jgi:serine/threonine kinase 16
VAGRMGNLPSVGGGDHYHEATSTDLDNLVGSQFHMRQNRKCKVDKIIAKGGFSIICICTRDDVDQTKIILKRIRTQGKEQEMEAMGEIRAHSLLGNDHPCSEYIVPLLEAHVEKVSNDSSRREISLFFPFYSKGNLCELLLASGGRIKENKCMEIFGTCTKAIKAIHDKNVTHCDVKPMNFMMAKDDKCVLIDFGSARGQPVVKKIETKAEALHEQERAERFCSAAFRAPELWDVPYKGYELDFRKCDVFALGCVLYSMIFPPYGYSPFESPTQGILPLAARTASFSIPEEAKEIIRKSTLDLVKQMLNADPKQRPSSSAVVEFTENILKEIQEEDFEVDFASEK